MADSRVQTLDDAYAPPANYLEIDVCNPETHGFGRARYTDYLIRLRVGSLVWAARQRDGRYLLLHLKSLHLLSPARALHRRTCPSSASRSLRSGDATATLTGCARSSSVRARFVLCFCAAGGASQNSSTLLTPSHPLTTLNQIVVPALPSKALGRQLPWASDKNGMFDEDFIEERRKGLEEFINKCVGSFVGLALFSPATLIPPPPSLLLR